MNEKTKRYEYDTNRPANTIPSNKTTVQEDDAGASAAGHGQVLRSSDPSKTSLITPRRRSGASDPLLDDLASSSESPGMADPVVGWLVIIKGPGKGNFVRLGSGVNTIGRDPSQRICLNFGDQSISRIKHAELIYDPRGKAFTLARGDGINLTYLGGSPVISPIELKSGDIIAMGDSTHLLFKPLCDQNFDWETTD